MNKKIGMLMVILMGTVILALTLTPVIRSVKFKKNGVSTESTVLKSNRISSSKGPSTYDVTVSFNTPDGNMVTAKARKRRGVSEGDKVMIYYSPAAPQKIDFCDSIGYNMRGVIVGGLIFILGFYLLFRHIINDSADKKLIRSGQKIAAEFVSVDRDERFRAGDKNPWIIKCKWIPYLNGRYHIDVFIDPADPGKYYMDTSFMPEGDNTLN
jgi:hypothetical protein